MMSLAEIVAQEFGGANIFDGFLIYLANKQRKMLDCACIKIPAKFKEMEPNYARMRYTFSEGDVNVLAYQNNKTTLVQKSEAHNFGLEFRFERWEMESLLILPLAKDKISIRFRRHY